MSKPQPTPALPPSPTSPQPRAQAKLRPHSVRRYAQRVWPRVAALCVLVLGLRWSAIVESLAFYVPSHAKELPPRGCKEVWIPTPDGATLHAWFLRASDAPAGETRPAVLHCHGNAGNLADHLAFSQFLSHRGLHVLLFDYRGYGQSSPDQRLTRHKLRVDSLAAFDWLSSRPDVDPRRIGVYGVSLGGGFALRVAAERPASACVCTLAAFSNWSSVASDHVPVLGKLLINSGLEPEEAAGRLGSRAYQIVHGARDSIVLPRHAIALERVAKAAGTPVTRIVIDDAGHNNIIEFAHTREVIGEFFARELGAPVTR